MIQSGERNRELGPYKNYRLTFHFFFVSVSPKHLCHLNLVHSQNHLNHESFRPLFSTSFHNMSMNLIHEVEITQNLIECYDGSIDWYRQCESHYSNCSRISNNNHIAVNWKKKSVVPFYSKMKKKMSRGPVYLDRELLTIIDIYYPSGRLNHWHPVILLFKFD